MKIPMLNGRTVLLAIDQIITPKTLKKIEGEGMKIFNKSDFMDKNKSRGDLYISFQIIFPQKISTVNKERLAAILK